MRLCYIDLVKQALSNFSRKRLKYYFLEKCLGLVDDEMQQVRAKLSDLLIEIRYKIKKDDAELLKYFSTVLEKLINDKSKFVS